MPTRQIWLAALPDTMSTEMVMPLASLLEALFPAWWLKKMMACLLLCVLEML